MIRPLTCLTFLLACGSGLYLYQSKHRASLLDAQIAQTVKATDALREQTRMLSAEWTLLNDPERLRQLATQFLTLQTVSPNQFTSLADLDSRLPPPVPPAAPVANGGDAVPSEQTPVPVVSDDTSRIGADAGNAADARLPDAKTADAKPADARLADAKTADAKAADAKTADAKTADARPADAREAEAKIADATPKDVSPPVSRGASQPGAAQSARVAMGAPAAAPHTVDPRPPAPRIASAAAPPRPMFAPPRPPEQRGPEQGGFQQRLAEARPVAVPRFAALAPRPHPAFQPGGSLLGMAHDMAAPPAPMPLPRPMPMNAGQWSTYSGSGG